jgi:hypothetical protein
LNVRAFKIKIKNDTHDITILGSETGIPNLQKFGNFTGLNNVTCYFSNNSLQNIFKNWKLSKFDKYLRRFQDNLADFKHLQNTGFRSSCF